MYNFALCVTINMYKLSIHWVENIMLIAVAVELWIFNLHFLFVHKRRYLRFEFDKTKYTLFYRYVSLF